METTDSASARIWDLTGSLRPAKGVSFSLLDERPVLFSEHLQKIYELNQTAAYIWCSILDNKSVGTICRELTDSGLDYATARRHLNQALQAWLDLELLDVDWTLNAAHAFSVELGRVAFDVQTSSARIAGILAPLFERMGPLLDVAHRFQVIEIDGDVHIFRNGACVDHCVPAELAPVFKARVTELVMRANPNDIALHAGCLALNGKYLVVSGMPGSGKSTLAVHLMKAGFQYAGDDIVLIAPDGRATGVAFPPSIKTGAWPIIERLFPDFAKSQISRRPDGQDVRYLPIPDCKDSPDLPLGWIVFINRSPDTPTQLNPLGQLETMRRLIDSSCSSDGRMTSQTFASLSRSTALAQSFELQYSDAADASNVLRQLCDARN